ncbi:MAG: glycosyltransferase family 4 protein [Acidobacteriota bacterium]
MTDARPLRIAFIGARGVGNTYSGIETYYEEVGSRLAARGHHVTAYCRTHFTPDVETYRGIHVRRLPSLRSKHLETISHSVLSLLDCLPRRFDVVQFHAIGSAPLALLPRIFGKKTVVSVRGLDWQRGKWGGFARRVLQLGEWASARAPSATSVVSGVLQEHYATTHGRRPAMIPNAVPIPERAPLDRIAKFGLRERGYLLFAGRLSPEKQVHVILEALKPLHDQGIGTDIDLAIAGGTSYSEDYIRQIRDMAWDRVHFLGQVDRATMNELYSHCHAYILPSVMEGLSVGLLEATSFGCAILTTDIPENVEVVGDAALTFPVGDVEALRAHLRAVLEDPGHAEDLRRRALERAEARPDWDEVTELTEALYLDLVGRASVARP